MKHSWFVPLSLFISTVIAMPSLAATTTTTKVLSDPLPNAQTRITKKFFGTYVTPKSSPVQPERFRGYHLGVDLETTSDEATIDVPVSAACTGKLRIKRWASGYGGVVVQSCTLNGKAVSVLYGHLRLSSVTAKIGTTLKQGQAFAVLGTGFSRETDGERKHLHFSIYKGISNTILGYVQYRSSLKRWIDPLPFLM